MSAPRQRLRQAAAMLAVTVVLLGAADLLCGYLIAPEGEREGDYVSHTLRWLRINPTMNPTPLVEDPDVLWRNEPGVRKTQPINPAMHGREGATWTIENDADGFRGPARQPGDDALVYRILCIGDSITFGFNVDQPAPFARQLERLLAERYPGRRFEVVNAGVAGWSWAQGVRFLEVVGLDLHPDLVVMGHGTNDQFFRARVTDRERLGPRLGPGGRLLRAVGARLARTNFYRAAASLAGPPPDADTDSPACQEHIRTLGYCRRVAVPEIAGYVREARRLTAERGIDLLVVNVDFMETAAADGVRKAVGEKRIPFIDFVARFAALRAIDEGRRAERLGLAPAKPSAGAGIVPTEVVLRVLVPRSGAEVSVVGSGVLTTNFQFDERMYDDGTHGDEVAGDGVFSLALPLPTQQFGLEYRYRMDGVTEFTPLPPMRSTLGQRLMRFDRHVVGPVQVFGEPFLMAERTHPNTEGHRVIAEAILETLGTMPSFTRFAGAGPPGR